MTSPPAAGTTEPVEARARGSASGPAGAITAYVLGRTSNLGAEGVRVAQKMQVGPCIPAGMQLERKD